MNSENKVPEIRFKGFSGEWEKKSLGEFVPNISDGDWIESNHIFEQGEFRIIQTGNLGVNGEYVDKRNNAKYFHQKDFDEIRANEIFPGDILISRLAEPAGRTIVLPNTGFRMVTAVDVTVIRPDDSFNSIFLKTKLNTNDVLRKVSENVSGTSHKRISRSNLEKTKLLAPALGEQTKIGNLFKQLDTLIAQHQQKHDKLLSLKKALLKKMFPKQGATEPEIRFKGFSGEWDEKVLGDDVADIIGGGTPSTQVPEYWGGDINWYSPTEIGAKVYAEKSEKHITQEGIEKSSARILPANKTVLFTSRAGIGDMAILKNDGCTNQGFQSFVLKSGYDTYFLYSIGHQIKNYAMKHASGSTFLEISGKQLGKMVIKIPFNEEQIKIGNLFKQLDTLINQHQSQLKKLGNIKQACLEKMFV